MTLAEIRRVLCMARKAGAVGVAFEVRLEGGKSTEFRYSGTIGGEPMGAATIIDDFKIDKAAFDAVGAIAGETGKQWLAQIAPLAIADPTPHRAEALAHAIDLLGRVKATGKLSDMTDDELLGEINALIGIR